MSILPNSDAYEGIMKGFPPPESKRVNLSNWDCAPYNQWSFQNIRKVLPTANISRGTGDISALDEAHQSLDAVTYLRFDGSTSTVGDMLQETHTNGFLLSHKGKIVTEQYFNQMDSNTLHLAQSVTKSFVGTIVGILIDQGLINPHAEIGYYVPELVDCGYGNATIQQVLDMRSGVRFSEEYTDIDSDIAKVDIASGWKAKRVESDPNSMYELLPTFVQERNHGGHFQYRSVETDVLGWACEKVTDKSLSDLLSELLWSRLGMENDALITTDSYGACLADAGLCATLRDYTRFGLMYSNNGYFNGQQIISEEWAQACRSGDQAAFKPLYADRFNNFPTACYSNQWWVLDSDTPIYCAVGVFGQMIYIDQKNEIVVTKLSAWPEFLNDARRINTINAIQSITQEII